MAALYAPSSAALAKELPVIADTLQAKLYDLSRDPTPERTQAVAAHLLGAKRLTERLRDTLLREQEVADGAGL